MAPDSGGHRARGDILGKYRLLDAIGHGAVGVVYRAEDSLSARRVAVKLIEPSTDEQREVYARLFFNEVRASGLLRHPNIVPVLDAGREGDRFYVVMEYVEGAGTLEPHCHAGALLPVDSVLELALDCVEALYYAHLKGVVHRDVKPANVLVDNRRRARLTDFGIAVLGEGSLADTSPFMAAGSPLYMAPEQLHNDAVTPRCDLFALGVVMYQMLCGVHPFAGRSMAVVVRRVLEEPVAPLGELRPELPRGLSDLVAACLAKRPEDRPASGLEVANTLSALLGGTRRPLEGLIAEGRAEQLRRLDFFRDFGEAELWELLRWAQWEEVDTGSTLVVEGEEGHSFFVIVEGRVSVRKGELEVANLGMGACFGEISYLSRRRRSASVVALAPVCVLRVNAALLENASERCQIDFQRVFIRTLIQRLVDTTEALSRRR